MKKIKNLNDLLDKNKTKEILIKVSDKLGLSPNLDVKSVNRSLTWLPETYIIVYEVEDGGDMVLIRASASEKVSRLPAFQVMDYLSRHGFSDSILFPLVYIDEYNLLLYKNIEGQPFINLIQGRIALNLLQEKVAASATWLAKMHLLNFKLPIPNYEFKYFHQLNNYYPALFQDLEKIKKECLSKINHQQIMALHGDYKPDNIIFDKDQIKVFDFNEAGLGNPMIDVASFLSQTKVMLLRFYNIDHYNLCETTFLETYHSINKLNDDMKNDIKIYEKLYYLKILSWLCTILPKEDPKTRTIISEVYKYYGGINV